MFSTSCSLAVTDSLADDSTRMIYFVLDLVRYQLLVDHRSLPTVPLADAILLDRQRSSHHGETPPTRYVR